MRRILVSLLAVVPVVLMATISPKYSEGYTFDPTYSSTDEKEFALSPYKDSTFVFVREDKVYVTKLDSLGELDNPQPCADFDLIRISGTVAYDKKRNRLYYGQYNEEYKAEYLYESISDINGKWQVGKRMRIRGTVKSRTGVSFVQSAGWNYRLPYIEGFYNPTMSQDNDKVYFSSTMEGGKGGRDLYYVEIEDEEQRIWSYPVNVTELNSAADDDWAVWEGDSILYFSSSRDGQMAVYSAATQDTTWKEPIKFENPYNEAGENYNMLVWDSVPMLISNRGGNDDIFLFHPVPPEPEPEPTYEEKKRRFYWVFFLFDFDRDILDEAFFQDLHRLATEMRNFPDCRFEISGYTDSRGSDAYNDKLSQRRAETIKQLLIEKENFDPNALVAVGYGERRLQVPNAETEEEHAQNRRVEVRIILDDNQDIEQFDETTDAAKAAKAEDAAIDARNEAKKQEYQDYLDNLNNKRK
ncbi:MAG: OmpA family protein [Paludibacteraceae bacterium]|nr:OmpA family protein [Paludibacteraceae bacterium]